MGQTYQTNDARSNDLLTKTRWANKIDYMDERSVDSRMVVVAEDDLLTGREAVKLLPGTTYSALMRWARDGLVPSVQYVKGGRRLFRRKDIEALGRAKRAGDSTELAASSVDGVLPGQPVLAWPPPGSSSPAGGGDPS